LALCSSINTLFLEDVYICRHVLVMVLVIGMRHEGVVWTNLAAVCKCEDVGLDNLAPE
jgi:hypothetical protein